MLNESSYFERRAPDYHFDSLRFPWSLIRNLEATQVDTFVGKVCGQRMLDLGCGAGYYSKRYIEGAPRRLVAVDISQSMVNQIKESKIECIAGDAKTLRLSEKFDIIISAGLLEFIEDFSAVLLNARHHISDAGRLILLVPRKNLAGVFYRFYHKRNGNQVRLFDIEDLANAARKCGWCLEGKKTIFPFSMVVALKAANCQS
jgi:SAM-dependent methyltransferase